MNTHIMNPIGTPVSSINTATIQGKAAQAAVIAHGKGYTPIPVKGKTPLTKSWQQRTHDVLLNEAEFNAADGVAIVGGEDGLTIIDFDVPVNLKGDSSLTSLSVNERLKKIYAASPDSGQGSGLLERVSNLVKQAKAKSQPHTIGRVPTPSGGVHIYIRVRGGAPTATNTFKGDKASEWVIDTRGGVRTRDGSIKGRGYVVAYDVGTLPALKDLLEISPDEAKKLGLVKEPAPQVAASLHCVGEAPDHIAKARKAHMAASKLGAGINAANTVEVREAMMGHIRKAKANGEDTTDRDWWVSNVLLPLVGDVAKARLPESEARQIFDDASDLAGGNTDNNDSQWKKSLEKAYDRVEHGEKPKTTRSMFAAQTATSAPLGASRDSMTVEEAVEAMGVECRHNDRDGRTEVWLPDSMEQALGPKHVLKAGQWATHSDTHDREIQSTLEKKGGVKRPTVDKVNTALKTIGARSAYDPFRDKLDSLPQWDRTSRLKEVPEKYLGTSADAADVALDGEIFRHAVRGIVARTYEPGCKHDEVMVLIGDQGCGKSTAASIMAFDDGRFFAEASVAIVSKDAAKLMEAVGGAAIVELSELGSVRKADNEEVKAMVSRTNDRARMAYAREVGDVARRFIFIGTENNDKCLRDQTGNRRFLPMKVGVNSAKRIDTEGLRNAWEQIMAEAVHEHRQSGAPTLAPWTFDGLKKRQQDAMAQTSTQDGIVDFLSDVYEQACGQSATSGGNMDGHCYSIHTGHSTSVMYARQVVGADGKIYVRVSSAQIRANVKGSPLSKEIKSAALGAGWEEHRSNKDAGYRKEILARV